MHSRLSLLPRRPLNRFLAAWALAAGTVGALHAQAPSPASSPEAAEVQRLLKEGQNVQALKVIDESLARNPKDPQMRFRRGVALSMLDRKSEALAVFQKLVEDHPDMPAPYNNMAVIHGAQGDYDKARHSLEKAIRTNPAYATAYQNLGDVYAQLASQAYNKALQLDKNDASVAPKLALLRELTAGPNLPQPAAVVTAKAAPKPASVVAAMPPPAPAPTPTPKPAVVTPLPVPVPAPSSAAASNGGADVEDAVRAWASAWSRRDLPAYVAAYTADFAGQSGSHKAWEQERRDRIVPRRQIKVDVVDLRVSVNGDQATARFRQVYASDTLSTSSRKTLTLVRSGQGKWMIKQEAVGG
jgi:tetratricopeptide (TPR) repeat protein